MSGLNWSLKFRSVVLLLDCRNAVQSAKSILLDSNQKFRSLGLITNLQYFVADYITEIDEFDRHFC